MFDIDVRPCSRAIYLLLCGFWGTLPFAVAHAQVPAPVQFNRDVRPILSDNCFFCHGPDRNKREADLRLDTSAGLFGTEDEPGPVVPGDVDESELIRRIVATDDEIMPPKDSTKSLTTEQIAILKQWVKEGATFEGHWSFLPITAAAQADSNSALSEQIDHRVVAELEREGYAVAPQADSITLVRRLHFDLLGLPPDAATVADFVSDDSPAAYSKLVDTLLASPHFGERMAVWWLDLVRYADTVGYHGDQQVSVSPFRDYVIRSFNANKPFDEFTIEQLAGDLLPEPTLEQRIASGYNRLGMMSAEGGVQDKEYLAKYIAERVRNVSGTWLGVTLGCAECHDHKFDPFTTRDFYRFEAFFADIKERGLYAGANSDGNWGPSVKVPTPEQSRAMDALAAQITELQTILDTPTEALAQSQRTWESEQVPWQIPAPESVVSRGGVTLTVREDQSVLASGTNPATDIYDVTFSKLPETIRGLRLEVLPDASLPKQGPGRAGNGNFVLTEIRAEMVDADGNATPVQLSNPATSYEQTGAADGNPFGKWTIAAAIDDDGQGSQWGWAVMEQVGKAHMATFEIAQNLKLADGERLVVHLEQNHPNSPHTIGCFRLAFTDNEGPLAASALPDSVANILKTQTTDRTEAQARELASYYRSIAPELAEVRDRLAATEKEKRQLDGTITTTLVTESVEPRMVRVLSRGNWMDESGEIVSPGFPVALVGNQTDSETMTRLDLARWLVADDNPLTARVTVNRIWKLLFGAGLSRKLDDVGAQGEWPSHPELLDLLADDFRNHWDVKRLIKAIVMSRAYRQSSQSTPELRDRDPYNRWLARQGRFRLDAEFVRDNAMSVSGLLVSTVGGVSVFPYQPPGYWSYLNFPTREWQNSSGPSLYRRGLYTHWQRQYLHPSLMAFDAPSREECTADRSRSNTPLQALVLLNDPSYVEAARAFAERVLHDGGTDEADQIEFAFRSALSRSPAPEETSIVLELLQKHRAAFESDPPATESFLKIGERPIPEGVAPAELAAWSNVARTIFNLHEFVTRQ